MKQYAENEGEFRAPKALSEPCRHCGRSSVVVEEWHSSDGAFVDDKYTCQDCGKTWWVEGIDS